MTEKKRKRYPADRQKLHALLEKALRRTPDVAALHGLEVRQHRTFGEQLIHCNVLHCFAFQSFHFEDIVSEHLHPKRLRLLAQRLADAAISDYPERTAGKFDAFICFLLPLARAHGVAGG